MADTLHFDLVSPERRLFAGNVDQVVVPGAEGDFAVLPKHAPFMSVIRAGAITVTTDGKDTRTFIRGGFAEVTPMGLTILAEEAIDLADVDTAKLAQDIIDAGEDVGVAKDDAERVVAQAALDALNDLQDALNG